MRQIEARTGEDRARAEIAPAGERRFGFILVGTFSLLVLAAAIEPLRAANRTIGRRAYSWATIADDEPGTRSSTGIAVAPDLTLADLPAALDRFDVLFVVTGLETDPPNRARFNAVLRQADRRGIVLGSLSAGAFILARAGLLEGHRCTVHWEYQPAFEETFPEIDCSSGLFVIDRNRWTGSGGITSLDMMLHVIAADHGDQVARAVGNNFQIDRIRNATIAQRPGSMERIDNLPDEMQTVVELMQANLEAPMRMDELAGAAGLNLRRMERLFQRHLSESPAQFYRTLRLERARELLLHTNLSTLETAMLTGFSSSSHFALAYQKQYGMRPSAVRRRAHGDTGEGRGDSP
jgi:transcriptional regulator GlxA family with amidase domain